MKRFLFALVTGMWLCSSASAATRRHYPLARPGDDYWHGCIAVEIRNGRDVPLEGQIVPLRIGRADGEAALVGEEARSIRVTDLDGREVVFAVIAPNGLPLQEGKIVSGSSLLIPAECPAKAAARYYVYFDNPSAESVPDRLSARMRVVNGDLEAGEGETPEGWRHDPPDAQHRAMWCDDAAQSGKRCVKTIVDEGAEPTWIATRQSEIRIHGGSKYVMRGWVKAEKVRGFAGWYVHVGHEKNPMLIGPTLDGGGGTYDWKEVKAEFTAPADADRASLGTMLHGTGVAWFDRVTLECVREGDASPVQAVARKPDRITLREFGRDASWPEKSAPGGEADRRLFARVYNFSSQPLSGAVCVETGMIDSRLLGRWNRRDLTVLHAGRKVSHGLLGNLLLIEAKLPPGSSADYYLTIREAPSASSSPSAARAGAALRRGNLVQNSGFDAGEPLPKAWNLSGRNPADGVKFSIDTASNDPASPRCLKLHMPVGTAKQWRGWTQEVPVAPGKTYIAAARLKTQNLEGNARIHLHWHNAKGALCASEGMTSVGPDLTGTVDWTDLAGTIVAPSDAASLQIHLTTDAASGTLWHDRVMLMECAAASFSRFETRPMPADAPVRMWPVEAVVKVFPDEPAPAVDADRAAAIPTIACARNEKEPLQLAIRGPLALKDVRVEVERPAAADGATLDDCTVNVVGYVPVDYPSGYYSTRTPAWRRIMPNSPGQCDGWAGRWPDPLLPRDRFDLPAEETQSVWITVGTTHRTKPGDYRGKVRLVCGGRTVAQTPFVVHVWNFTLPDQSRLTAIYEMGFGPGASLWGMPLDRCYREVVRMLASRRLCPSTLRTAPKFQHQNGRVTADFTEYDREAEWYFGEMKLPHSYMPGDFYSFGWGLTPKDVFGEAPYPGDAPYDKADRAKLRPEYRKLYQERLRLYWEHMKAKGWDSKLALYVSDEPFFQKDPILRQLRAVCEMIHEVDPKIPVYSSTWNHVPEWNGQLLWGLGHYGCAPADVIAERKAAGERVRFTTDGQMCLDTPLCAVERLLPHYCFKYDVEAYEFWGTAWLTHDPYRFGWHAYILQSDTPGEFYRVRYPNGDGFLIYPGEPIGHDGLVSSVRLEQAREGMEDYEYLFMLRSLVASAEAKGASGPGAAERTEAVAEAKKALAQASELVAIPNAGGRYSSKVLPEPGKLYRARAATAAAIERLQRNVP